MIKNMKCQDCGKIFSANTENVNECGNILDVQCSCGSWEVDIAEGEKVEQILPKHLRKEENKVDSHSKLDLLYKKYNELNKELLALYDKQLECLNRQLELLSQ